MENTDAAHGPLTDTQGAHIGGAKTVMKKWSTTIMKKKTGTSSNQPPSVPKNKPKPTKLWTGESVYCVCGHHIEAHAYDGCMIQVTETRNLAHDFFKGDENGNHPKVKLTSDRGWVCRCEAFSPYEGTKKDMTIKQERRQSHQPLADLFPSGRLEMR